MRPVIQEGEGVERRNWGGPGLGGWRGLTPPKTALTCHNKPPLPTLSPQGFSVQGQYGAVTPAEVSD